VKQLTIAFLVSLTVFLLATPLAAEAQQVAKIPRVGVLRPGNPPPGDLGQREAFEGGLRDLGWTPGTTILIEYRYAEGVKAEVSCPENNRSQMSRIHRGSCPVGSHAGAAASSASTGLGLRPSSPAFFFSRSR
jgi:hypothetical protein